MTLVWEFNYVMNIQVTNDIIVTDMVKGAVLLEQADMTGPQAKNNT